jgi:hypothetical protein
MKVTKCRSCPQSIVWMTTEKGKPMPVNAQTVRHGDLRYDISIGHISHWLTCPEANKHSKAGKRALADDRRVYDESELQATPKRAACYVPENLPPAVEELYRQCQAFDLNRGDVRVILAHQYGILGDPRCWDAATIARAAAAIDAIANTRDAQEAALAAARDEYNRLARSRHDERRPA